jgi:heme exporter protein CcmD
MIDAPHFGFVLAAYVIAALVIVGMIGAIAIDYRVQNRALRQLESGRRQREAS